MVRPGALGVHSLGRSMLFMGTFSGVANDLADSVDYELNAIEYLRATLFEQSESPLGGVSVTLGD